MAEHGRGGGRRDKEFRHSWGDNIAVVLHDMELVRLLSQPDPLDHNWIGLAGRLGYTAREVQQFEQSATESCMALLQHWQRNPASTIRAFETHLQQLDRKDVLNRLYIVLKNEFDLVGVLLHDDKVEEVTVHVHGKITLREAFTEELAVRRLKCDDLELVDPTGNSIAYHHWDSPAYELKGQQVTLRKKKSKEPSEQSLHQPIQCEHTCPVTSMKGTYNEESNSLSLHLSRLSTNSSTQPKQPYDSNDSMPMLEQLKQQEHEENIYDRLSHGDAEIPENIYESIYQDCESSRPSEVCPPPVLESVSRRPAANELPEPRTVRSHGHQVKVAREEHSQHNTHGVHIPEWVQLPGWHDLGVNGAKKRQIRHLLGPHLGENGNYVLTSYPGTDQILISVTYMNKTKSFLVKQTETNNNSGEYPIEYYLFSTSFHASSIQRLLEHYKAHKLSDQIQVKLKNPVT
ncbi:hypothetical protein LSAT2_017578 [Lamellibrachia satsuma]|nr:hypothetical protein LSAT2_017578 [Lamellibrachia satsuma]